MTDVSSLELRDNTAAVLRRVEAGEVIRANLDRHPVADLVLLSRLQRTSGAAMAEVLGEAPADRALLEDLGAVRGATVQSG